MLIEYDNDYAKTDSIKAYGYYTTDINNIQYHSGEELDIIEDKTCRKENAIKKCQDYIRKGSSSMNYVILQVSAINSNKYFFEIKYGKQEEYSTPAIYLTLTSIGIGLALSLPNIVLYILNKIIWKNAFVTIFYLLMDIILHLGYFNIISKFVGLGGEVSYTIGTVCIILFVVIFFCYFYCHCKYATNEEISGLMVIIKRLLLNDILEQAINFNRNLFPNLFLNVRTFYKESQEKLYIYGEVDDIRMVPHLAVHPMDIPRFVEIEEKVGTTEGIVKSEYSDWKRTDEGGGRLSNSIKI